MSGSSAPAVANAIASGSSAGIPRCGAAQVQAATPTTTYERQRRQPGQRPPCVRDGLVHLRHPALEIAAVKLSAILLRQPGRWHWQYDPIGRIIISVG